MPLSATLQTDVRLGFYRYRIRVQPNGVGTTPATDAGLPGLNTGTPETSGMPAFYINGNGGFNFGYALGVNQCNCPLKETENHFQIVNNWTKQIGNHNLKWGADLRRAQQQRIPSDSHRSGEISFNDSTTGSAEADTLAAGKASTGSALASFLIADPSSFARYFTGAGFHPGLRQNAAVLLRTGFVARHAEADAQLRPALGGLPAADSGQPGRRGQLRSYDRRGAGGGHRIRAFEHGSEGVQPRVRAARGRVLPVLQELRSAGRRRAQLQSQRTGRGLWPGRRLQSAGYESAEREPDQSRIRRTSTCSHGPPAVPNPPVGTTGRYPLPDGISVYYYTYPADSYRIPEAYFWNLAVETEFTNSLAFELAYVGNVGRHLFLSLNENQAVPGPGDYRSATSLLSKFRAGTGHLPDLQLRHFAIQRAAEQAAEASFPRTGFPADLYLVEGDG